MTLDFALTCAETSVALSPGITNVVCNTNPNMSLDPATAQATSIQLLELDQFQKILRTDMITDVQENGATIQYQSYIASSQTNQVDRVPGSLEIAIMARDATVTSIYQQLVIQFSNDCSVYPVLVPEQQIGWLKLASLEAPPTAYCPAAAGATNSPTAVRTPAPTPSSGVVPNPPSGGASPRPTRSVKIPTARPTLSVKTLTAKPSVGSKGGGGPPTAPPTKKRTHHPTVYCPPLPKSKKGHVFDFAFGEDGCYYPVSKSKKGSKGSKSLKSAKCPSSKSSGKGKGKGGKGGKGKGGGGGSSSKGQPGCPEPPAPHSSSPVKPPLPPPSTPKPTNRPGSKTGIVYTATPRTGMPTMSQPSNGGGGNSSDSEQGPGDQLQTLPPADDANDDPQQSSEGGATQSADTLSTSSGAGTPAPSLGKIAGYVVASVACTILGIGLILWSRKYRRDTMYDRSKRFSHRTAAVTTAAEESVPINASRGSTSFSTNQNLQPSRDEYSEIYMQELAN